MQVNVDDLLIAAGARAGIRQVDVVFRNPNVSTAGVPCTVWPVGGLLVPALTAAAVEVLSSSAEDNPLGTGAFSVDIHGLDADWNEVSEEIVLNGITPVAGTVQFLRINQVHVHEAGSTLSNVGNLTVRAVGAGAIRSYVAAARGRSEVGLFSVPAGHTMLAVGWLIAARDGNAVGSADVEFFTTRNYSVDGPLVRSVDWTMVVDGTLSTMLGAPHVFTEKTDIEVIASRVLNNGTVIAFHGHGIMIKNGTAGF